MNSPKKTVRIDATKFRALILDMDGVFVDTEPIHFEAFRRILSPKGIDIPDDYLYRLVGDPARKNFMDISRDFHVELDVDVMIHQHEKTYLNLLEETTVLTLPGVGQLLSKAANLGWKIGLCTSSPPSHVRTLLRKVKRDDASLPLTDEIFHSVVTYEDVEHKKPHPEPYLKTAQKLGVAPRRCLVIEDSLAGVKAAKAAGCYCAALRSYYNQHIDFSLADFIIQSLSDLVISDFSGQAE